MGGYGTWALAGRYPDRFAAIAPVCGGGSFYIAYKLNDVPVWAFHGAKDDLIPLKESEDAVNFVKQFGGDARLTVYADAGHDSWTQTYDNEGLYDWFLKHRKSSKGE
jgi:predicted peptidase